MKTTKKILAAFLVFMIVAMMIPFSAAAAESYTLAVTGKAGYTATVYKVADLDTTTGTYSNVVAGLESILNTKATDEGIDSAALLNKCEAMDVSGLTTITTLVFEENAETKTFTNAAGVFYIKVTGTPEGVSVKKTGGAVLSNPYYKDNKWTASTGVTLKIEDGSVSVSKAIVEGTQRVSSTTANIGDTITYELKASTAGSVDQKLSEYTIHDNLSSKLTYKSVASVKLDDTALDASQYTVDAADKADIKIALAKSVLDSEAFYAASNVYVTLTAELNSTAVIGKTDGNTNSDSLTYTNAYGPQTVPGNKVEVYTFELPVKKVDANTNQALSGAQFTLYSDSDCTTVAKNGTALTTDADGMVTFKGLDAGTYYVKETAAPKGYNLNAQVVTVTISDEGVVNGGNAVVVKDTPIVMPATGGMGTMLFTVIGISLIACAGVLFVVLKKKKAAK